MDTNKIVALEEALVNLMNQQAMILIKNYDHIVSQPIDYKLDMYVILKQNCQFD